MINEFQPLTVVTKNFVRYDAGLVDPGDRL